MSAGDATEVRLREAKARLSELLDRAGAGERVEIVRGGPKGGRFRILALDAGQGVRRAGALAGRLGVPEGFDDEDPAIADAFEGG